MNNKPRAARPGDVCVLLEPSEDEAVNLRQRQMSLQALFGGRLHESVHLTCQRFELHDECLLPDLIRHLGSKLVAVQPFPIVAVSLVQLTHPFWQSRLLRWRIQGTSELQRFGTIVEGTLVTMRITPHFLYTSGWKPTLVTALEAIPEVDLAGYLGDIPLPHHLFVARQVVLSRIKGRKEFEILGTIQLSNGQ